MRKIRQVAICFLLLLLCAGRVHGASFHGHHLATGIDIHVAQTQTLYRFRQSANMETILNYLRLLQYDGIPEQDPELLEGNTYRITVYLADGSYHIYHVHADRYLSRNYRPWEKVESDRPLSALLQQLPAES